MCVAASGSAWLRRLGDDDMLLGPYHHLGCQRSKTENVLNAARSFDKNHGHWCGEYCSGCPLSITMIEVNLGVETTVFCLLLRLEATRS